MGAIKPDLSSQCPYRTFTLHTEINRASHEFTMRIILLEKTRKMKSSYVSEKDFMVLLCRLETAILPASFTARRRRRGKSSQ
jgi:hypothetical protein